MKAQFRKNHRLAAVVLAGVLVLGAVTACSPAGESTSTPAEAQVPPVARSWVDAWNGADPTALGALFTPAATYTDLGVLKTSNGPDGITAWKRGTNALIPDARFTLADAFGDGDAVAIRGTYGGTIKGAPKPFAVPMVTILRLEGDKIAQDTDYYNLSDLLRQSGLPPTWTPPGV